MQNACYVRKFCKLLNPWSLTNKEKLILPSEVKGSITNTARLRNETVNGKQESNGQNLNRSRNIILETQILKNLIPQAN